MPDATGRLWGRLARVTVALPSGSFSLTDATGNALVIDGSDGVALGLRVVFKVTKTIGKHPNAGEITIFNLAPTTRAALTGHGKGARVNLEVGYVSTGLDQAFLGDARTVDHERKGADWETVIKCGDGERSYRFARASESFAGGCAVGDVVRYCAAQMGLALGNSTTQAAKLTAKLAHGWTAHGAASTELDRICRSVGYRASIQDGQIQILAPGTSLAQTIPDITPETGLIGSPEQGTPEKKGKAAALKFKSLLLAQARPGGRVHLKSERYDGIYRVRKCEHEGDTHGLAWYTVYEAVLDPTATIA